MTPSLTNWAGNLTFTPSQIHRPETVEQVQELVAQASHLKALGTRHSFNNIANTTGELISLERLNRILSLDRDGDRATVTIQAGVKYGDLGRYLHSQGYAIHNFASLPHISVAGGCATATHGSGDRNGNLATAVAALNLVTADGQLLQLARDQNKKEFEGAVVNLGALGVVTQLTLDILPAFEVSQTVYENLLFAQLADHLDDIFAAAYSVSLFTDWQTDTLNQVWVKALSTGKESAAPVSDFFQATPASGPRHPLAGLAAVNCTQQMGLAGPAYERLPHFRMDFTPSSGEELQTEYLIPRQQAWPALQAINSLRRHIAPHLQISELRTIAADSLWMSPCYQQACLAIHFTWKKDWPAVRAVLPQIETALAPFSARPHWGKLFTLPAVQLQPLYPKLPQFLQLVQTYDPHGKFRNDFLEETILANA